MSKANKNHQRAAEAWHRIKRERESIPNLDGLWRTVCMNPNDAGPIAPLADCLIESGKPEMVAQGEYFSRVLSGVYVARPRLGHWIAELSETQCVSQQGLHGHGMPSMYSLSTLKWALPWLRVFGLFPIVSLRVADRRPQSLGGEFQLLNCWQRAESNRRNTTRGRSPYDISTFKHVLPHDVFRFLDLANAKQLDMCRAGYATYEAACVACDRAIVDYARSVNGMPPLYCVKERQREGEQAKLFDD